ncbi:RICIN domain-containing protein [Streptomyces sp. NPDC002793]|uniref:RICIN domain-containing protein n=1 Tax=Streptomyces sp. NPDC002793 TaxID=3154432 RepID=UPI0033293EB5
MVGPIESAPPTENSTSQKPRSGKSPAGQGGAGGPRVGGGSAAGTPVARGVGGSGSSSVGEDPKPLPRPSAAQTLGKSGSSGESSSVPGVSIRSHHSGRCIDVTDGEGDGTPLQIWGCSGAAQQTWRFMDDGTVRSMGLCMDVAWGATGNGAVIQLARCSGHPAQQFRLNSSHDLVNPQADKCVDVREQQVANGSRLQLWDCNGQDYQKWSAG